MSMMFLEKVLHKLNSKVVKLEDKIPYTSALINKTQNPEKRFKVLTKK